MPPAGPINRRDLIAYLGRLDFLGPFSGGRHQFMQKGAVTVIIPNPHRGDIDWKLLSRILRQAGVTRSTWEAL